MNRTVNLAGADLLTSPEHRLITVIGAGGKTSFINWLGMQIYPPEQRVIITSTTKIFPLQGVCTVLQDDNPDFPGRINQALSKHSRIVIARKFDSKIGKLIGITPEMVDALHESGMADTILVEADGAARKPLKAPAQHEPVIPKSSEICVGVMGLDAAYRSLTKANVHRPEIVSRITKLATGNIITPEHMVSIAMAPNGLFKGSPPDSKLAVVLNKADIPGGNDRIAEFETILQCDQRAQNYTWFAGSIRKSRIKRMNVTHCTEPVFSNNRLEFSHQF